jgi:hypothetical protein
LNDRLPRSTYRADVLLCPIWVWERPQEIDLLADLFTGLLGTGRSVLILLHRGTTTYERLRRETKAWGAEDRVTLLDPRGTLGRLHDRLHLEGVIDETRAAAEQLCATLQPTGLTIDADAHESLAWTTRCRTLWARWAPHLQFNAAIVRCHWLPLCSDVAQTAHARGVPVTTLQQGVVSHTMDVPVRADRYVCFGEASRSALSALDRDFADAVDRPVQCTEYVPAGSLIDPIETPPPAFGTHTLLVVGQFTDWATDYYGLHDQKADLLDVLHRLLASGTELREVRVRPHPAATTHTTWAPLRADFPERVTLSDGHERPIADDLRDASAAIGLFSGALATAAAWGRPTFFLKPPGGFRTPDRAPFAGLAGTGGTLLERIQEVLQSRSAYRRQAQAARAAAANYYQGGEAAALTPSFVDGLLSS